MRCKISNWIQGAFLSALALATALSLALSAQSNQGALSLAKGQLPEPSQNLVDDIQETKKIDEINSGALNASNSGKWQAFLPKSQTSDKPVSK